MLCSRAETLSFISEMAETADRMEVSRRDTKRSAARGTAAAREGNTGMCLGLGFASGFRY